MPNANGGDTPLKHITQRGQRLYTVDKVDEESLVSTAPDPEVANWVGYALAQWHQVPLKVEEPGPGDLTEAQVLIQGPADDPAIRRAFAALGPEYGNIPEITEAERRAAAEKVLGGL